MKKLLYIIFFISILFAKNSNFNLKNKFINYYTHKEYKKAFNLLKDSKSNSAFVLNNLAFMYYKGLGTSPNQYKAVQILNKAIKKYPKVSNLYFNLALMNYFGYVKQYKNGTYKIFLDRKKAKELLLKAIKLGNKHAKIFYEYFYIKKHARKK